MYMFKYSTKWIIQRLTAFLLIPFTFWFVYNCILFSKLDYNEINSFFNSFLNSTLFLIMMIAMLIHAKYGCETIVEDYISSKNTKKIILIIIKLVSYFSIIISLVSVVVIYNR